MRLKDINVDTYKITVSYSNCHIMCVTALKYMDTPAPFQDNTLNV